MLDSVPIDQGRFEVNGDTGTFITSANTEFDCNEGETGNYRIVFPDADRFTMSPIDDECVERSSGPARTYARFAPDIEGEALPAPDADIIAFTEAFGVGDSDTAWSYVSARCGGGGSVPVGYVEAVDGYAAAYPEATAVIVGGAVGDNDTALITYDVYDGSGEFAQSYDSQQWAFVDGKWYRDAC